MASKTASKTDTWYKVNVCIFGPYPNIWQNFRAYCGITNAIPEDLSWKLIMRTLATDFRGKDVRDSTYLKFKTEEDALLFILRFS